MFKYRFRYKLKKCQFFVFFVVVLVSSVFMVTFSLGSNIKEEKEKFFLKQGVVTDVEYNYRNLKINNYRFWVESTNWATREPSVPPAYLINVAVGDSVIFYKRDEFFIKNKPNFKFHIWAGLDS